MKTKQNRDDQTISRLVQSVQLEIPSHLDKQVDTLLKEKKASRWPIRPVWSDMRRFFLPAAALAGVIVLLVIFTPLSSPPAPQKPVISEIRTEFELKDKNIKIIWFQKEDFKLRRNSHES